ncbi:COMPASS complex protein [Mariannaea sp. PMI_226]|nr:COMPASS complex protein [Mariannaea sp. PMI_226]
MASSSEIGSPKRESTPTIVPLSSIPQKRALDEGHSPAVPSPLNPEVKPSSDSLAPDDAAQAARSKSARTKKETLKKRESKGVNIDSARATPDPKATKQSEHLESGPLRYKLAPPKLADFDPPRGPVMTPHHEITISNGGTVEFFETSDHVSNKKNFRYNHCIADPLFPSTIYYRQTESEPFGPRMSFEDAAGHVFFDKMARLVTTNKGFRMARANVAVREGRWYWECKIVQGIQETKDGEASRDSGMHVRMGWARREASLDAPVGFDAYSYGIRDVAGEKVHMSRPKDFFPPGQAIQENDVIGLEIQLPSEHLHRKIMSGEYNPAVDQSDEAPPPTTEAPNVVRDRVPIRFKAHTYFEKNEYHPTKALEDLMNPSPTSSSGSSETPSPTHPTPDLRTLPNSCIRVYKNGVLMGTAFENLLGFLPPASRPSPQQVQHGGAREGFDDSMLGYYPAVSVFRGGTAEVNFGPDFWYPPPGYDTTGGEVDMVRPPGSPLDKIRAVSERYHDQIAEDIVYDIIDEVDFWMQDGGGATDREGVSDKSQAVAMAPGREEIKELLEDD